MIHDMDVLSGVGQGLKVLGWLSRALELVKPPAVHAAFDRAWATAQQDEHNLTLVQHDTVALAGRSGADKHDELTADVLACPGFPTVAELTDILLARWRGCREVLPLADRNMFFASEERQVRRFLGCLAQAYRDELTALAAFGNRTLAVAFGDSRNNDREASYASALCESLIETAHLWTALGVPGLTAHRLAADPTIGHIEMPDDPVVVVTGPPGSGKSLAVRRAYQGALETSLLDPDAAIPIWVDARRPLTDQILEKGRRLGTLDRGIRIFSDPTEGSEARDLVAEFFVSGRKWTPACIVVTSRVTLREAALTRLDGVSAAAAEAIVRGISGRENARALLSSWPPRLREAMKNPAFAVLAGVGQIPGDGWRPKVAGELMDSIVRSALPSKIANATAALMSLGAELLDRGVATVPSTEFTDPILLKDLVASGILVEVGSEVGFPVSLVADWYAAKALGSGARSMDKVLSSKARSDQWRYALTIAMASSPRDAALQIFRTVAAADPGLAGRLVADGVTGPAWPHEAVAAPSAAVAKEQWQQALEGWEAGLGELYSLAGPVGGGGEPLDTTFASAGGALRIQTLVKSTQGTPRLERLRAFHPGHAPAWSARATMEEIGSGLADLFAWRALPTDSRPLVEEELWGAALRVADYGEFYSDPIGLDDLENVLSDAAPLALIAGIGSPTFTVSTLTKQISALREQGESVLAPPWPVGSQSVGYGPPSTTYTYDDMAARVEAVFSAAIEAYGDLVARWFGSLTHRLPLAALLPAKLVGHIEMPTGPDHEAGMEWYFEAVDDMSVKVDLRGAPLKRDAAFFSSLVQRTRERRPGAPRNGWFVSQLLEIFGPRPATDIAYRWLWGDLTSVGLVRGMLPTANEWDIPKPHSAVGLRLRAGYPRR